MPEYLTHSTAAASARAHTRVITEFARRPPLPAAADLIGRSWWRCLQQYGLQPGRKQPARIVTRSTLKEHQDAADELLAVARAGVNQLYASINGLGYVLLLTDHAGVTVQFHGERDLDDKLRQAGLYLGADWDESYAGTCAVGTCIQEQTALTCHRGDHFDGAHISLTCTAAPIFGPSGELIAVLDISALNSPAARDSQMFALHLTQLYARMIEDAYFLRRYRRHLVFRCDDSREFVALNGRVLLALDDTGTIVAANTAGRLLLADNPMWVPTARDETAAVQAAPSLPELLASRWDDILAINQISADGVQAFRLSLNDQTVFGTLIEPKRQHDPSTHGRLGKESARPLERVPPLDRLAGDDAAMRKTIEQAKRFRQRDVNLLILGETGTGKDMLATAIHASGHRRQKPFVALNCAAIPESLIESELFGYSAGAFTGGRSRGAKGLVQQADGGTLFLDEIGDMPLPLQTRLLRVLAEGEVTPLGADKPVFVDCRVIAATHHNIQAMIERNEFRADLYYRLNGATLTLPPLRQRADREFLIRSLLAELKQKLKRPELRLRADVISALLAHSWPGNVRELVNVLAYAEANSSSDVITLADLPELRGTGQGDKLPGSEVGGREAGGREAGGSETGVVAAGETAASLSRPELTHTAVLTEEGQALVMLLDQHDWNLSEVARVMRVSRPTLYRRIRKFRIRRQTCVSPG